MLIDLELLVAGALVIPMMDVLGGCGSFLDPQNKSLRYPTFRIDSPTSGAFSTCSGPFNPAFARSTLIAAQLGISEDTVKAHMKSILLKLGANDRTHAVTITLKRGIIDI
jgi:Bacterial regulatory proteins, luxR family